MRALKVLALLSLVGFLAVGCGDDDEDAGASGSTAAVTEEDDGSTVELGVGQPVEVSLEICIGCGYVWEVVSDLDDEVLELVEERDLEVDREPGMTGGQTQHVKTFRATGEGSLEVQIGYIPPGESAPEETVTFTFDVT